MDSIDLTLLTKIFPKIVSFKKDDQKISGGMVGDLRKLEVQEEGEPSPKYLVVKSFVDNANFSKYNNYVRESKFYRFSMSDRDSPLVTVVPKCHYVEDSMIVMDDLSREFTLLSHVLGNQCWGAVDLPESLRDVSHFDVVNNVFVSLAKVHAKYWRDESLFTREDLNFLKYRDMLSGENEETWTRSMNNMKEIWNRDTKPVFKAIPKEKLLYPEELERLMDELTENSSWSSFKETMDRKNARCGYTLSHSDCHAANMMVNKTDPMIFKFFDWPEAGIFCGFTDISQFVISNIPIEFRREHEKQWFINYYNTLIQSNPSIDTEIFTLEYCYTRYKIGGIERWLQLENLMAKYIPEHANIFFHNQVSSFIHDHYPDCKNELKSLLSAYVI